MLRLVKTNLAPAGKTDPGERAPSFFVNLRTHGTPLRKGQHLRGQIVTHKIKLVLVILLAGMERRFRGRQREDQPSTAGIHGCKSQNVPEEGAIGSRVLAVYHYVCTGNHTRQCSPQCSPWPRILLP